MPRTRPKTDRPYDPAPYAALAVQQQAGHDIKPTLADLIADANIRPGLMATRLNRAGITGPTKGAWVWTDVSILHEFGRMLEARRSPLGGRIGKSEFRVGSGGGWERT